MQEKSELPPFSQERKMIYKDSSFKVGLLLPLTGPQKKLGDSLQKMAEWAYVQNLKNQGISLVFEDSQGTPLGAQNAFKRLIKNKVQVVIGPVFAQEAKALIPLSENHFIPILSLSNDRSSAGGLVFILGTSPLEHMNQSFLLAKHAGVSRILAFLPYSPYGDQLAYHIHEAARSAGIQIKGVKRYSPQNPYTYGALSLQNGDGLFIPEGAPNGEKILDALYHQGIHEQGTILIGSPLWLSLSRFPEGSIFAAPDKDASTPLMEKISSYTSQPCPSIGPLFYDTLFLSAALKGTPPSSFQKILTQTQGFKGLEAPFRLTSQGYAEKHMAFYKVKEGRPFKIQEASSFGSP